METITVWVLDSTSLECGAVFKGTAEKLDDDCIEFWAGEAPGVVCGKDFEWFETEAEALEEFQVRKKRRIELFKRKIENMRQEIIRLGKLEPKVMDVAPNY